LGRPWDRLLEEISKAYDGDIIMIDSTCVRVHQQGATGKKGLLPECSSWVCSHRTSSRLSAFPQRRHSWRLADWTWN